MDDTSSASLFRNNDRHVYLERNEIGSFGACEAFLMAVIFVLDAEYFYGLFCGSNVFLQSNEELIQREFQLRVLLVIVRELSEGVRCTHVVGVPVSQGLLHAINHVLRLALFLRPWTQETGRMVLVLVLHERHRKRSLENNV